MTAAETAPDERPSAHEQGLRASMRLSVAPMLDWTDRHCRYFLRLISRHTLLYTEMVTTGALIHGDRERFLRYDEAEHPVALQLGGSDPAELAACARMGAEWGYDEINLNLGCPSDRVQSGRFGACLMAEPALVADCIAAMKAAVAIPVTAKTRIGIDDRDSYAELVTFFAALVEAGCDAVIVHARKAWLQGLSPRENPRDPAVALRLGLPPERGLSERADCAEWRGHDASASERAPRAGRRRHDRPRRVSDAMAVGRGGSHHLRRPTPRTDPP